MQLRSSNMFFQHVGRARVRGNLGWEPSTPSRAGHVLKPEFFSTVCCKTTGLDFCCAIAAALHTHGLIVVCGPCCGDLAACLEGQGKDRAERFGGAMGWC